MNLVDKKRKLRIIFHAFILVAAVFFLFHLEIELPKNIPLKTLGLIVAVVFSFLSLLFIMVRVCFPNVKRWEMVIYYSLDIIFVCLIVYGVTELCYITSDYLINSIPYVQGTDEYYVLYDEADGIAWTAGFMFVLFGIPSALMTIVFTIVGITLTCTQSSGSTQIVQPIIVNQNQPINPPQSIVKINYCRYCGNRVDKGAKFCRTCGKQLK